MAKAALSLDSTLKTIIKAQAELAILARSSAELQQTVNDSWAAFWKLSSGRTKLVVEVDGKEYLVTALGQERYTVEDLGQLR